MVFTEWIHINVLTSLSVPLQSFKRLQAKRKKSKDGQVCTSVSQLVIAIQVKN